MVYFNIIASLNKDGIIGSKMSNDLLYDISVDKRYFKMVTLYGSTEQCPNIVIMGKNTWLSIPSEYRPFDKRLNIIISSTLVLSKEQSNKDNILINKTHFFQEEA